MAYWQAGAAVLGAYGSYSGGRSANAANVGLNRANREWQERMSNTAYQRSAKDLEKAGLNRILALGGPASSPTNQAPKVENTLKDAAPQAAQAALTAAQIKNIESQTEKTKAETIGVHQMNDIKSGAANVGKDAGQLYEAGKGFIQTDGPNVIKGAQDIGKSIVTEAKSLWDSAASKLDNFTAKMEVQELKNKKFTDNTKRWHKLSNGKWYDLKNHKVVEIRTTKKR